MIVFSHSVLVNLKVSMTVPVVVGIRHMVPSDSEMTQHASLSCTVLHLKYMRNSEKSLAFWTSVEDTVWK